MSEHVVIIALLLAIVGLLTWPHIAPRLAGSSPADEDRGDESPSKNPKDFPKAIGWLLDAPLFIDKDRVEAFYDAVLRPDFEQTSLTLAKSVKRGATIGADLTVKSGIPWITEGEVGLSGEISDEREQSSEAAMTRVVNPYRHLLALAFHYADRIPERLVLGKADGSFCDGTKESIGDGWTNSAYLSKTPRALAMLDLPSGTEFIPTALQLENKKPALLFDEVVKELAQDGTQPPTYPGSAADVAERNRYWQWFLDEYNDRKALSVIEKCSAEAAIEWIDFRVPVAKPDPVFLHVRFRPRTTYESGVFAYSLVSRTYKHGLRLIGTLKSEPDLDVLAAFDC